MCSHSLLQGLFLTQGSNPCLLHHRHIPYHLSHQGNPCCYCSVAKSCPGLCDPLGCSTPGFPVLHCLLEFAQIYVRESVMLSNHLILCLSLLLPSIFPSIRVFSSEPALLIRTQKYRPYVTLNDTSHIGQSGASTLCLSFLFFFLNKCYSDLSHFLTWNGPNNSSNPSILKPNNL